MSPAPITSSAASDNQKVVEAPKTIVAMRTRPRRRTSSAHLTRDRQQAEGHAAEGCADAGRGAQPAEACRPHVQYVGGIHRQQRSGAAEQHGEQVERDGAEHQPARAHEAQA